MSRQSIRNISFPQAESDFRPSLFTPTETWRGGSDAGYRHLKNAFTTLNATLADNNYRVNDCPPAAADIVIQWSAKHLASTDDRSIVLEHGWLPRYTYQASNLGSNSRSHVARSFNNDELDENRARRCGEQIARVRALFAAQVAEHASAGPDTPFVLVPFQLASDFNLRDSNSDFADLYDAGGQNNPAFAQRLVDHVEALDLPWPVLFKQHPGDRSQLDSELRFSHPRSQLLSHRDAVTTHALFAGGNCRLVIGINSNTLHEALVWNVPVIALGTLLWREDPALPRPLSNDLTAAESVAAVPPLGNPATLAYLDHLLRHQWHLSDFQNPLMVAELLRTRGHCEPAALRDHLGISC